MGGRGDDAGRVDDAGAGDADAEQRALGVGDQLPADAPQQGHGGLAGLALAVVRAADDDLAGQVDEGADELRRLGEVDAQDVATVGGDVDERGRLADAAGRAQPELLDDTVVDEVTHDRADRRPGQPGDLRQVGPRHRAVAVQRAQQQAAVGPSRIFRRRHAICLFTSLTNSRQGPSEGFSASEGLMRGPPARSNPRMARDLASAAWPSTLHRVAAFTAIPEVDLARWAGSEADRVGAGRRGARRLPRDRLLPARRPRRAGRLPGPLLRPPAGLLRPPRGRQGRDRQGPLTALPRLGARRRRADRQPHRLPRAARRLDREPAVPAPTRSRRTCASTGPTSGCPTTSCPASTAPSTELFDRLGAVAFELMEVHVGRPRPRPRPPARGVRRAPAVAGQADQLPADAAPARPASTPTTTPGSSPC